MVINEKRGAKPRSVCPINCTLELIGDKWSLLIIRDILFSNKHTYNEFLSSEEKISTNILENRLAHLTAAGIITYTGAAKRKKYSLTEKGLHLKPVLDAIIEFGSSDLDSSESQACTSNRTPHKS